MPVPMVLAEERVVRPSIEVTHKIQEALNASQPGDIVRLTPGVYRLSQGLTLSSARLTFEGAGKHRTILIFDSSDVDAHGLAIVGDGITVRNLSIEDAPVVGMLVEGDTATLEQISLSWSSEVAAVAVHMKASQDHLVHQIEIEGAIDTGLLLTDVGATHIEHINVQGAQIGAGLVDSSQIELYDSMFSLNSLGIGIVRTVPQPPILRAVGKGIRIYRNQLFDNNVGSTYVSATGKRRWPRGAGVAVIGTPHVDIFNNSIQQHGSFGVGIFADSEHYQQAVYPSHINVFDNKFSANGAYPDAYQLGDIILNAGPYLADIVWDGRRPLDELLHISTKQRVLHLHPLVETTYLNADMGWADLFSMLHWPSRDITREIRPIQSLPPLPKPR